MCALFVSDKNQVGFFYESGLYAAKSGTLQWIGQVQNHNVDPNMNVNATRYVDGVDRNVDQFVGKAQDYAGVMTYYPQDWKFLGFFLGSVSDGGTAGHYTHNMTEMNSGSRYNAFTSGTLNPFMSFGMEDAQVINSVGQNFIRTVQGACVDSFAVTMTEGEIISVDVNYLAQNVTYASGAESGLTALTTRPYLFSDVRLHKPSGTILQTFKNGTFTGNNTMIAKHYMNGSQVAAVLVPTERNYDFPITLDANNSETQAFWDSNFIAGSTFNMMLEINAATTLGSRNLYVIMSGCRVMDMDAPSPIEGINENTVTIQPRTVYAQAIDEIIKYNPW